MDGYAEFVLKSGHAEADVDAYAELVSSWHGEAESNSYAEFASRIGPAEAELDGYAEEAYTDAAEDVDVG